MYKELTLKVIEVAKQAGEFIRNERRSFAADKIEYKGFNDLVSYVDKTAETMIVEGLKNLLPKAGFITEEKTVNIIGNTFNWIIDPLDGTTNFIHGVPVFAVSIALKKQEELVVGVIYEVNLDECFYAWKGSAAYLNGQQIKVSQTPALEKSLLATGFPYYDFARQSAYIKLFTYLMQHCHGLRRMGSAAVDLAYTACGRFDAFYEYNLKPWDIAAGILIVRQAGGKVVNFEGEADVLTNCDVVATNNLIDAELVTAVKDHFN